MKKRTPERQTAPLRCVQRVEPHPRSGINDSLTASTLTGAFTNIAGNPDGSINHNNGLAV
jgi:hypothetical protein